MRRWRFSYRRWTTRCSDGPSQSASLMAGDDGHAVCGHGAIGPISLQKASVLRTLFINKDFSAAYAAELLSCFAKGLPRFHCV